MNPASAMPASVGPASSASAPGIPIVGARRLIGTLALSLATFMSVLDISIANVSIPAIAGDLGVSPHQGTWIITSFGVATAISLPLTGWLGQRICPARLFGRRRRAMFSNRAQVAGTHRDVGHPETSPTRPSPKSCQPGR